MIDMVQAIGDDIKVVRLADFPGMPDELTFLTIVVLDDRMGGRRIIVDAGDIDLARQDAITLANSPNNPSTWDGLVRGLLWAADSSRAAS